MGGADGRRVDKAFILIKFSYSYCSEVCSSLNEMLM